MGHSQPALSSFWTFRTILRSDTSSNSIIFDRTDNAAFSRIAKGSANRFFPVRLTAQGGACADARGVGLDSYSGGGLSGNPGTAARFAMADDSNRTTAPADRRDRQGSHPPKAHIEGVRFAFRGRPNLFRRTRCRTASHARRDNLKLWERLF